MGGTYYLEYLLAIGFVFLGLLLVCLPRPRKAHMMTPEQYAKQQANLKRKQAFADKQQNKQKKVNIKIRQS